MWRRLLRAAATGRRGPGAAARALSTAIEEKTPEQFLALNGSQHATSLLLSRSAVVYSPAPSVMQQAKRPEKSLWLIKFEPSPKWSNPLTGWTASRDPLIQVRIKFNSREAAVQFAETHGLSYRVQEAHVKQRAPKSYATNFKWKGKPE
ncbi:NADH dehydrogenase [ubiquinone] iron-sulfur protein 4, mitochondrial [Plasmodiophora brassicae]|uniref:NADH dehydrogenase [ubiquinone] iron-sulfur protein 4, mitochondrial n=1 Tax=Plasmodiophora brassicae TaxID=37360 RepID=A0A0G4II63_PLABS|nr:hypothetical protein PBRA_003585 [Plasmodiophora brassicae]SPQ98738.1 unnamed protein product [Plasmodiophora brassicae]